MKSLFIFSLIFGAGSVHAACEDMYLIARILQPGMCTPRTEYEWREIARSQELKAQYAINSERRLNASLEMTRQMLAQEYGVPLENVSVSRQKTSYGYGFYSINNGQFVCQESRFGGFGCLDQQGRYAKGLSEKQIKHISEHTFEATINENGELVPAKPRREKKRGRALRQTDPNTRDR